jgi:hypothetical protein
MLGHATPAPRTDEGAEDDHVPTSSRRRVNGRLTVTTAYRIVAANGHPDRIDMRTLDILCDVFGVGPGELLERDRKSA